MKFIFLLLLCSPRPAFATTLKILKPASGTRITLGEKVPVTWEIRDLPADSSSLALTITGNVNNLYPKNGIRDYQWNDHNLPQGFDIFHDTEKKQIIRLELTKSLPCPPDTGDCLGQNKTLAADQIEIVIGLPKNKNGKSCKGWFGRSENLQFPHGSRALRCLNEVYKIKSKEESLPLIKEREKLGEGCRYILCVDGNWWQ